MDNEGNSSAKYDISDIMKYFDADRWSKMPLYEKQKYLQMYKNHSEMIKEGFDTPPPNFMLRMMGNKANDSNEEKSDESEDTSDEEQIPTKKFKKSLRIRNRVNTKDTPSTSKTCVRRYPKRNVAKKNYYEEEILPDDRYIYCDDCMFEWEDYCKVHGDLIIIRDFPVPKDPDDPERAKKTIPKGWMTVKQSRINGEGVWSLEYIPEGIRFGPYEGEIQTEGNDEGYCWELRGKVKKCIDAYNPGLSNWMRYVNCARNKAEQNLMAYQYCGVIYYRTLYEIKPHTELLVWYGTKFAKQLGIDCKMYNAPLEKPFPENVFQCPDCHNNFASPIYLDQHIVNCIMKERKELVLKHKSKKPASGSCYICEYCKFGFSSDKYLEKHKKFCKKRCLYPVNDPGKERKKCVLEKKSVTDNQYKCDQCDRSYVHKRNLQRHRRIHGDNAYTCDQCGNKFGSKHALARHEYVHSSFTQFRCDDCDRVFRHKDSLQSHKRLHGDNAYTCGQCGNKFATKHDLVRHEHVHSDLKQYQCDDCGARFKRSSHLSEHMSVHSDEKPHECIECGAGFKRNGHLKSHMRTHTGERPYVCTVCEASFTQSVQLNRHRRKLHTSEE